LGSSAASAASAPGRRCRRRCIRCVAGSGRSRGGRRVGGSILVRRRLTSTSAAPTADWRLERGFNGAGSIGNPHARHIRLAIRQPRRSVRSGIGRRLCGPPALPSSGTRDKEQDRDRGQDWHRSEEKAIAHLGPPVWLITSPGAESAGTQSRRIRSRESEDLSLNDDREAS
jgi:hypothetical protein